MSFISFDGFSGGAILLTIVPVFIFVVFFFVFGLIISKVIKFGIEKTKDVEVVSAKVLSKRQTVWGEHSHTYYFATFELSNGQRVEYSIPDTKIGYLLEGDEGMLSFQGKLFVGFIRQNQTAKII